MRDSTKGIILLCIFAILVFFLGGAAGEGSGYKRGQLDYATGKIEYTIIDGKTIHYLGESK